MIFHDHFVKSGNNFSIPFFLPPHKERVLQSCNGVMQSRWHLSIKACKEIRTTLVQTFLLPTVMTFRRTEDFHCTQNATPPSLFRSPPARHFSGSMPGFFRQDASHIYSERKYVLFSESFDVVNVYRGDCNFFVCLEIYSVSDMVEFLRLVFSFFHSST